MRLLLDTHVFIWSVTASRLLLAQAFAEPLRLVTTDRALAVYGGTDEVP